MSHSINFYSKEAISKGITFSTDQAEGIARGRYHLICYDRIKRCWINLKKLPRKEISKLTALAKLLLSGHSKPVQAIHSGKVFFQDSSHSSLKKHPLSSLQNTLFEKLTKKKKQLTFKEEQWAAKRQQKTPHIYKAEAQSLIEKTLNPLERAHKLPKGTLQAELHELAPSFWLPFFKAYPPCQSRALLLNLKRVQSRYKRHRTSYLDIFHYLSSLINKKTSKTKTKRFSFKRL